MATSPYYKQSRLKQLRAFCFAAREGSISRAAEQLCLSQPSVLRRQKHLLAPARKFIEMMIPAAAGKLGVTFGG